MIDLSTPRNKVLFASAVSAVLVGLATLLDLISGYPFRGIVVFDITFFICSLLVGFMAYDAWTDFNHGPRRSKPRRAAQSEQTSAPAQLEFSMNAVQAWPRSQPGILDPVIRSISYDPQSVRQAGRIGAHRHTSTSA